MVIMEKILSIILPEAASIDPDHYLLAAGAVIGSVFATVVLVSFGTLYYYSYYYLWGAPWRGGKSKLSQSQQSASSKLANNSNSLYPSNTAPALLLAEDRRNRLPNTIILIRHGESEANADKVLWKSIPDNLLGLTAKGRMQANAVGERVENILQSSGDKGVHLVISPFERTLQTASCLRSSIEHRIVRTDIESRIREQEVGNLQGDEFVAYRAQQKKVGRFWYRFPTGESGADVFDRVKSWWFESVLEVNQRYGFDSIDAMVVVTHGLTMRFILMQLFSWSPTTLHSVWNAGNCDAYVLRKDLNQPGPAPYVLDKQNGDMPRSSIDVSVKFKSTGEEKILRLEDYLSVPPPRTTRTHLVKKMLAAQYPTEVIDPKDIEHILFMPFIEGAMVRGRSTSGVISYKSSNSNHSSSLDYSNNSSNSSNGSASDDNVNNHHHHHMRSESDDRLSNYSFSNNSDSVDVQQPKSDRSMLSELSIFPED